MKIIFESIVTIIVIILIFYSLIGTGVLDKILTIPTVVAFTLIALLILCVIVIFRFKKEQDLEKNKKIVKEVLKGVFAGLTVAIILYGFILILVSQ